MKVKCIVETAYFTVGEIYNVTHVDRDGDIWVEEDDDGHPMFMTADECEYIGVEICTYCKGTGKV